MKDSDLTKTLFGVKCDDLVSKLTGVTLRKRKKLVRMLEELEEELDTCGLVIFCGNCTDNAILAHRATGIFIESVGDYGCFMGGDWTENRTADGISYMPDLSSTSGDFANAGAVTPGEKGNANE